MRVQPFRAVSPAAVSCSVPALLLDGQRTGPDERPVDWTYISDFAITGQMSIDAARVAAESGLSADDGMARLLAVLRVDCPSTGRRFLWAAPIGPDHPAAEITVKVPGGTAAQDLEVRYELVLDGPDGIAPDNRAAYLKGSRLFTGEEPFRFTLEGDDAVFPVEAVRFRGGEFPRDAAWLVKFSGDDLNAPFLGSVRLFVNKDHPAAEALLGADNSIAQPIIIRDILTQMLVSVALTAGDEALDEFDEGSTGACLEELCASYLDTTLRGAVDVLTRDPGRLLALLQAGTGFLKELK
ncbi:hypothetical protein [Acidipropionibacterium jensenii]|uniref:hypothetical protein n=1 Tax=Acidipropionibacterium jensenii TaxID=1749 RepID=UPI000BC30DF9|nr:hypothetical protein [Acidipropionibacterium jensenii]